ncbi:sensor histidine kinase [Paenibacillus sp. MCAF20]
MREVLRLIVMRVMNLKFFTKIFISISIVSVIGVFSIVYIYQQYFQKIVTENEMERVQRSINQAGLNLDNQLNRVVQNVYYFFYYSDNGTELIGATDRNKVENALEAFRTQYSSELESVLLMIKDNRTGGEETMIYDENLDRVRDIDYKGQAWYRHFLNKDTELWSRPTKEHLFYQDRSYKTIYLTLARYDDNGRDGMLVVRLNGKLFSDAFRLLAASDLLIELKDAQGHIVYSSFPEDAGSNKAVYLKMDSKLSYSGFEVQAYINQQAITGKVRKIQNVQPFVIVVILLITLVISIVLSLTLVQPIRKLLQLMKKVEIGDLDVRFATKYTDEIGLLGRNFNKMLANLSEMIDKMYVVEMEKINAEMKQKDATLLAMQNQINPHFLYNTLEVINCQAIINEVPAISRMSKAMADFFRYTIDNPMAEVELRVEIDHVKTYLEIQHERYPDIEIDLDELEPFNRYPIVKLTLQPIVENAFHYAFIGERDYYLKIYAEDIPQSDAYALYIEDNGQGMDENAMAALNLLFERNDTDVPETDASRKRGIGLLNVHNRIRLRYGEPFGLSIEESMTGGVTVRIVLPKEGKSYESADR